VCFFYKGIQCASVLKADTEKSDGSKLCTSSNTLADKQGKAIIRLQYSDSSKTDKVYLHNPSRTVAAQTGKSHSKIQLYATVLKVFSALIVSPKS
jgi:hypothetical protein